MTNLKRLLALSFALSLAACGSGDEPQPQPSANAAENTAETAPRPPAPYPDAALVLSADGISVKGGDALGFGTDRAKVDDYVGQALAMGAKSSRNEECGAGATDFSAYGPLQLLFQDGKFSGWYLREADPGAGEAAPRIVTIDGIGPGARMDALAGERQVRPIVDSTLEGEFEYLSATGGMITGFYRGDAQHGTVVGLASGLTCFFR